MGQPILILLFFSIFLFLFLSHLRYKPATIPKYSSIKHSYKLYRNLMGDVIKSLLGFNLDLTLPVGHGTNKSTFRFPSSV